MRNARVSQMVKASSWTVSTHRVHCQVMPLWLNSRPALSSHSTAPVQSFLLRFFFMHFWQASYSTVILYFLSLCEAVRSQALYFELPCVLPCVIMAKLLKSDIFKVPAVSRNYGNCFYITEVNWFSRFYPSPNYWPFVISSHKLFINYLICVYSPFFGYS